MSGPEIDGVVISKSSRHVRVDTQDGVLRCSLRGRFRGQGRGRSPVVVGDRVCVELVGENEGVLDRILPRDSELIRGTGDGRSIVVAANLQKLLVVLAARDPPPRWTLVDRMLACAERDELEPAICLNKWDQVSGEEDGAAAARLEEVLSIYRGLGYRTFAVSAIRLEGLEPLIAWLEGATTVLSGHSGVGKSTLLNALDPGLDLKTGKVNAMTGKGRHTTSAVSLLTMPFGGYVADTPGFRSFSMVGMDPPDLGKFFLEFRPLLGACRYSDCLHGTEPDCAVRRSAEQGVVTKFRYENYLQILRSFKEPS